MHKDILVKYALFLTDWNKLEYSPRIFEKHSSIKFHVDPDSGK